MSRRLVAVAALVVCIVAVAAVYASGRGGGDVAGPLRLPTHEVADSIITTGLGRSVALGTILTSNPAAQPAVLDKVTLIDPTSDLRFAGAYAALVGRDTPKGAWGVAHWPPPGEKLHPLSGVAVPANSLDPNTGNVQIVLRLALDRAGTGTFRSFALDYHIGSHHYHAVVPEGFRICYPLSRYKGHCDATLPSQLK
jgi:hypothetical protein